jgi:uncharacterized protein DUF998
VSAVVRRLGLIGLAVFVTIVTFEHLGVSDLSPATHVISEYANAGDRALMTAGFLAWALSLGAVTLLACVDRAPGSARNLSIALTTTLGIAATGAAVTACFRTQTSVVPSGVSRSLAGRLHDLGSGTVTLGLLLAALASAAVFETPRWYRRAALALVIFSVATDAALLAVGPSVGGLRQRVLLAAACTWQLLLIAALDQRRSRGLAGSLG